MNITLTRSDLYVYFQLRLHISFIMSEGLKRVFADKKEQVSIVISSLS